MVPSWLRNMSTEEVVHQYSAAMSELTELEQSLLNRLRIMLETREEIDKHYTLRAKNPSHGQDRD